LRKTTYKLIPAVLILILSLCSCMWVDNTTDKLLTAHFIDVSQGDCVFITLPDGQTMLIDAGSKDMGETVAAYISSLGVKKIDFLIATHPHEDHIGGLPFILNNFEIGQIYMPDATANTAAFENLLTAVEDAGKKIDIAAAGAVICENGSVKAEFLAPGKDFDELNDNSAVIKLTFGKVSFLFTGDAEWLSEAEMLKTPKKLKADILKVGHHGSGTSTSDEFLNAVSPSYAVISCGENNSYGHPHADVLERLSKRAKIYRTDLNGTVVITTDGENTDVKTRKK